MGSTECEQRRAERKSPARRFVIVGTAFGALLLASAAVAIASGWSIARTPKPSGRSDSALSAVSCASASACIAVGAYFEGGSLVERWNGSKWSIEHAPRGYSLDSVSCVSASDCTAVGERGANTSLAERWNGSAWSIEQTPKSFDILSSVSCVSATACTAVGGDGQSTTLAEGWNGSEWSIEQTPHGGSDLSGVSCVSASYCIAVGFAGALRHGRRTNQGTLAELWNGTGWSIVHTPHTGASVLNSVSCVSASACIAVGDAFSKGALIERWNGTTWSIERPANVGSHSGLNSVSCVSASHCTAVGASSGNGLQRQVTVAESWNGTRWSLEHTPNLADPVGSTPVLYGVSCASASVCIAVGQHYLHAYSSDGVPLVERWRR